VASPVASLSASAVSLLCAPDADAGASAAAAAASTAAAAVLGAPPASPHAATATQQDRMRCQVPGCGAALDAPPHNAYNVRCRLCTVHMRADSLVVGTDAFRFCQKCNRLQPLSAFDLNKHTCIARLQEHNKRRRERNAPPDVAAVAASTADAPPVGRAKRAAAAHAEAVITRMRQAEAAGEEEEEEEAAAVAPMGATHETAGRTDSAQLPPPQQPQQQQQPDGSARTIAAATAATAAAAATAMAGSRVLQHALTSGDFDLGDFLDAPVPAPPPALLPALLSGGAGLMLPPAAWYAGAAAAAAAAAASGKSNGGHALAVDAAANAAAVRAAVLHIKMPSATPAQLPAELAAAVAMLFQRAPMALQGAVRPGCVLLTVDALVDVTGASAPGRVDAAAAVTRLLGAPGAAGAFFRAQPSFSVHVPGQAAAGAAGGVPATPPAAQRRYARTPPVRPLAALSTNAVTVTCAPCATGDDDPLAASATSTAGGVSLEARMHGHVLRLLPHPLSSARGATLPPMGTEGIVLFETSLSYDDGSASDAHLTPPPRPMLLTRDADIAAEVAALGAGCDDDDDEAGAAELVVTVIGHALRADASVSVLAAAAAAATLLGCVATLRRLLPALRASAERHAPSSAPHAALLAARGGVSLLQRAAAVGRADLARMILASAGGTLVFGTAAAAAGDGGGVTSLHLAAAARDGGGLAATLTDASLVSPAAAGDALAAWFHARCAADGRTPSHIARGSAGGRTLDDALRARYDAAQRIVARLSAHLEREGYLRRELLIAEALSVLDGAQAQAQAAQAAADAAALLRAEAAAAAYGEAALLSAATADENALETDVAGADEGSPSCAVHGGGGSGLPSLRGGPSLPSESAGFDSDAFTRWRASQSRALWRVSSALLLLKAVTNCMHCYRSVLFAPTPWGGVAPSTAQSFIAATPFHDPLTGAVSHVTDVPWDDVVAGTRRLLRATALFRLPTALAAALLAYSPRAWAWGSQPCRYEQIFLAILLADAAFFVYTDWLIADVTGGLVVEWPSKLMALRSIGLVAALQTGPFSSGCNRVGWVARVAFSGGTLLRHAALRPRLWLNAGYRLNALLMGLEALCEGANQRRLRRKYAAHVAQAARAKKQA
jgi:hypothetical protein